jgi:hypothetical protein
MDQFGSFTRLPVRHRSCGESDLEGGILALTTNKAAIQFWAVWAVRGESEKGCRARKKSDSLTTLLAATVKALVCGPE